MSKDTKDARVGSERDTAIDDLHERAAAHAGAPGDDDLSKRRMSRAMTRAVGVWLLTVGVVAFVGLVWMWLAVERLGDKQSAETIRWIGPDFRGTESGALLVLVAFAAIAGSVVHMVPVFTLRAGHRTLEAGYGWWYLLRPVAAGLLGVLFYLVVRAGLFTLGGDADPDLEVEPLVVAGGLAGLFTDRVMQRMLALLGSTNPEQPASMQGLPGMAPSSSDEQVGADVRFADGAGSNGQARRPSSRTPRRSASHAQGGAAP